MPERLIRMVEPVIRQGIRQLETGLPVVQTLRQVALTSALIGTGVNPIQAIQIAQQYDPTLLGITGREGITERFGTPGIMPLPLQAPISKAGPLGVTSGKPIAVLPHITATYVPVHTV